MIVSCPSFMRNRWRDGSVNSRGRNVSRFTRRFATGRRVEREVATRHEVNISEPGVLFRTDQKAPAIHEIEMRFRLPAGVVGEGAAQVACRGVITRTVSFPGSAEPTGLAVRIGRLHFERPRRPPVA